MNYAEWEKVVPAEVTEDSLWKMKAYRLGLFAADIAWHDATKLMGDRRTMRHADQLFSAVGSISANIAEGYSRGTGRDRARFYEYALGSAREARTWYYQCRHTLGETLVAHRLGFLTEIARLLLTMVPNQRGNVLRETGPEYAVTPKPAIAVEESDDAFLLEEVPLPTAEHEPGTRD
jgi:four helix bundle protein